MGYLWCVHFGEMSVQILLLLKEALRMSSVCLVQLL